MPDMPKPIKPDDVIAILCSDIHLSAKPPAARTTEPSWYDAMARQLDWLDGLAAKYDAPIICAGDVFDRWNSPPELINFALEHLPHMYAIPGQHDLPLHNYEDIQKSAYWSMVLAHRIVNLEPGENVFGGISAWAYPWGFPMQPLPPKKDQETDYTEPKRYDIAVVHAYIWKDGHCYQGADEKQHVKAYKNEIKTYYAAVFGDNHKGFLSFVGDTPILNSGGFMLRHSDQVGYTPSVGLLCKGQHVERVYYENPNDKFIPIEKVPQAEENELLQKLLEELTSLGEGSFDFREAVRRRAAMGDLSEGAAKLLLWSLEP